MNKQGFVKSSEIQEGGLHLEHNCKVNEGVPKVAVVTPVALHIRLDYVQKRKHLGFYEHDLMDQEHSSTK